MLRKSFFFVALAVLMAPAFARAEFDQGDWYFTLSGSGASDKDFVDNGFSAEGSLGYLTTDNWSLGVRQQVAFNDNPGGDNDWNASTSLFTDYFFEAGRWAPFIGASIGYLYGDGVDEQFVAGPEGGVLFWVNSTTFIQGLVQYQFLFEDADEAEDAFDDGRFLYSLGLGVTVD